VVVTKPWAVNVAEAETMITTAAASKRQLLPWLPARWGCDLLRLQQLVSAGTIGNVFAIRRTVSSFGTRCDWQTESRYGGGYILNWGPHIVDPPVILGNSPVKSVFGRTRQAINPGDVEDLFHAVITLENGTIIHAEYTISIDTFPTWVVQGDRGTITVRSRDFKIIRQTPVQPTDPTAFASMQAEPAEITEETVSGAVYGDEHIIYQEIADSLANVKPYPVTPADALGVSRILEAIKISSKEDRVVNL
jgi:predicted dehydrogenase